jgi:hypothetical protein
MQLCMPFSLVGLCKNAGLVRHAYGGLAYLCSYADYPRTTNHGLVPMYE